MRWNWEMISHPFSARHFSCARPRDSLCEDRDSEPELRASCRFVNQGIVGSRSYTGKYGALGYLVSCIQHCSVCVWARIQKVRALLGRHPCLIGGFMCANCHLPHGLRYCRFKVVYRHIWRPRVPCFLHSALQRLCLGSDSKVQGPAGAVSMPNW